MKNLKVNLNNEPAAPEEKLISYRFVGGVSAAAVVYSIVLEALFIFNLYMVLQKMLTEDFPDGTLWLILSAALVALGCAAVIASIIVRIKVFNRYGNRGFEIYPEKIVFTQDYTNDLKICYKSIPLRVVVCVLIGIYMPFWLYVQVKNTRAIKYNRTSCVGEMLLLLFVPFYSYYWFFTRGKLIHSELTKRGYSSASRGWLFLLFAIFGLDFISIAIMQRDFNGIPEDTFSKEAPELEEDSYTFDEIDKMYIKDRALFVETKAETRKMPLTSRDFRWNLESLLNNNQV